MSSFPGPYKPVFAKPNLDYSSSLAEERLNSTELEQELAKFSSFSNLAIETQRKQLPIYKSYKQILYALETSRVVIIVGETGSGKSTQLPQYLMEHGWSSPSQMICVTEPRRIATINLAKRICEESSTIIGQEVGYAIRFEDCFTPGVTQCKFVTDGLLIREMMQNPLLPQYSVIILDEVHERNANMDIIIGLLKKVMKKREDLRIVVCSATVDAEELKLYFDEGENKKKKKFTKQSEEALITTIISVEGRYYPIEILYLNEPCDDYVKTCMTTAMAIHISEEDRDGDILIFLTGQDEVEQCCDMLIDRASDLKNTKQKRPMRKLWILPLYGTLPHHEQLRVFEPTPKNTRKIIVSTNIAETSLTIHNIACVIDCGFMKLKAYDSRLGSESLITVPVSKSSASQRAGRAGRHRNGKCYRLYTEFEFSKLREHTPPEIQRCDLASSLIQLKALGIDNICKFDFLSLPPSNNFINTLELLHALKALDHNAKLTTPLGFQMAEFPLHPCHSKALLTAPEFGCTNEIISIIAMLQVQHVFQTPANRKQAADKAKLKFTCTEGDHLTLLNVYKAFEGKHRRRQKGLANWCGNNYLNYKSLVRAVMVRAQLARLLKKFKINCEVTCGDRAEPILKCLTVAFFMNVSASHYSGDYRHLKSDLSMKVHPSSVVNLMLANLDSPAPKYILYNDIVQAKTTYLMRDISVIDFNWLQELIPEYYEFGTARQIHETNEAKRPRIKY